MAKHLWTSDHKVENTQLSRGGVIWDLGGCRSNQKINFPRLIFKELKKSTAKRSEAAHSTKNKTIRHLKFAKRQVGDSA